MSSHKQSKGKAYKKKSTMKSLFKPVADQVLFQARDYPIMECLIFKNWRETGLTNVVLSRRQPDGRIAHVNFMVDLLCLGVKDCYFKANMTPAEYNRDVVAKIGERYALIECSVEMAHAIVYGAVDYARSLGLEPCADYSRCQLVLQSREAFDALPHVEFGKDSKPLYVSGPHDNPEIILTKLRQNVGEGNFHYITGM